MISAKKIRTLKPRVQLRRAADVFHEAAASDPGKEYLDEILSIVLSSDLVCDEDFHVSDKCWKICNFVTHIKSI